MQCVWTSDDIMKKDIVMCFAKAEHQNRCCASSERHIEAMLPTMLTSTLIQHRTTDKLVNQICELKHRSPCLARSCHTNNFFRWLRQNVAVETYFNSSQNARTAWIQISDLSSKSSPRQGRMYWRKVPGSSCGMQGGSPCCALAAAMGPRCR